MKIYRVNRSVRIFFQCQSIFLLPASRYWLRHNLIYFKQTNTLSQSKLIWWSHYLKNRKHPVFVMKSGLNFPTKFALSDKGEGHISLSRGIPPTRVLLKQDSWLFTRDFSLALLWKVKWNWKDIGCRNGRSWCCPGKFITWPNKKC